MNKYQYIEYTSHHPKSIFKGVIMGECIRYAPHRSTLNLAYVITTSCKQTHWCIQQNKHLLICSTHIPQHCTVYSILNIAHHQKITQLTMYSSL